MKVGFEGREWELDADDMDVRQAIVLHMTYGMTIAQYSDGFDALDQRTYHFAYWLMLQQNGTVKPIADCNPKIIEFIAAVTDARVAEGDRRKAEEEAKAAAEAERQPAPFPQDGPPSAPATPTATTPQNRARKPPPTAS